MDNTVISNGPQAPATPEQIPSTPEQPPATPESVPAQPVAPTRRKTNLKSFEMPPGTLKIKLLTTLYKDRVSKDQKDENGFWTATLKDGRHCFLFHKDDPEPSFFEPAGGWKAALLPVFTHKLGMKFTSAQLLLDQGLIKQSQFDSTAKGSKTACQFWAFTKEKKEEEPSWKPKSKWTSRMVLGAPPKKTKKTKKTKESKEDEDEEEQEEQGYTEEDSADSEAEEEEVTDADATEAEAEEEDATQQLTEAQGEDRTQPAEDGMVTPPAGATMPPLTGMKTFQEAVEALEERYVASPRRSSRLRKRLSATPPQRPTKKARRSPARKKNPVPLISL